MNLRKGTAMADSHEHDIYSTLVSLADTLVDGFDVLDLADRLVESALTTLGASTAGILLDDQRGSLRVLAASSEETHLLELLELQNDEGPCLEAFRGGQPVIVDDLEDQSDRWPGFGREAVTQGVRSAYAIPMRLRDRVIAERSRIDMGAAFEVLRTAARSSRRPLIEVAAEVVHSRLAPAPGGADARKRPRK